MIIYHHNSPAWAENVRLTLPIDKFAGAHVRFEYRHCSSNLNRLSKLPNNALMTCSSGEERQEAVRVFVHEAYGQGRGGCARYAARIVHLQMRGRAETGQLRVLVTARLQ